MPKNASSSFNKNRLPTSQENTNELWWRPALQTFAQMSGWIGIPVIGGLFLGRWLDDRFNTTPWLFLLTVGVAFIISTIGIMREATRAYKKVEKESNKNFISGTRICFQHEIGKEQERKV